SLFGQQHVLGENDTLKFECTGCILPDTRADYYCPEITDLFYFRCRIYNSTSLVWTLLHYNIPLVTSTSVDNVIRKGSDVTVLVERIVPDNEGITANFSSHLWIDFKELPQNVRSINVTCGNTTTSSRKELLALGAVHSPTNINTTADILDPSKTPKECFVYYEWHHPNPDKVLYYKTEIFLNSVKSIHKMNIPQEIQNATCLLGTDALSKDDHYLVVITTVDRCNQRASNSKRIDTTLCSEPQDQCSGSGHQGISMHEGLLFSAVLLLAIGTV
ncbi:hypothetical protein GBAR_LOCUS3013, partial [Geodia barretti]